MKGFLFLFLKSIKKYFKSFSSKFWRQNPSIKISNITIIYKLHNIKPSTASKAVKLCKANFKIRQLKIDWREKFFPLSFPTCNFFSLKVAHENFKSLKLHSYTELKLFTPQKLFMMIIFALFWLRVRQKVLFIVPSVSFVSIRWIN